MFVPRFADSVVGRVFFGGIKIRLGFRSGACSNLRSSGFFSDPFSVFPVERLFLDFPFFPFLKSLIHLAIAALTLRLSFFFVFLSVSLDDEDSEPLSVLELEELSDPASESRMLSDGAMLSSLWSLTSSISSLVLPFFDFAPVSDFGFGVAAGSDMVPLLVPVVMFEGWLPLAVGSISMASMDPVSLRGGGELIPVPANIE